MDTRELALDPNYPAGPAVRDAVGLQIADFLAARGPELDAMEPRAGELLRQASMFGAGGKRLRPAFCLWGWVAATGDLRAAEPLVAAAASLDLLHLSALVHDDVMDESELRRGRPASHKQFEELHRAAGLAGDPELFGRAGAILLGDLLLMWSVQMLHTRGPAAQVLAPALPLLERMRTEVTVGQYLDVLAQATPLDDPATVAGLLPLAERVLEFKTASYTVVRPLQFGAALGGAEESLLNALAEYALPLGRAFQLRDDLLGVFGDEQVTGKPAGDDLREGKRTALLAHALAGAAPADREELAAQIGRADLDLDLTRSLIVGSGAVERVESMITENAAAALEALSRAGLGEDAETGLTVLVDAAINRVH